MMERFPQRPIIPLPSSAACTSKQNPLPSENTAKRNRLDVSVVWLGGKAFDLGEFHHARRSGADGLTLQLDRLALLLGLATTLSVGLDSVEDYAGRYVSENVKLLSPENL